MNRVARLGAPRLSMFVPTAVLLALYMAATAAAATLGVDAAARHGEQPPDGSDSRPFPGIQAALDAAAPGDEVVVRAGIYREQLRVPAGEPGKPIVLRAADGARVIVTPAQPIAGWEKTAEGLWTTRIDFRPTKLFVGRRPQPPAREPNRGWWQAESAGPDALVAPRHLRNLPGPATGGEVYAWIQRGNYQQTIPIAGFDPAAGRLRLGPIRGEVQLAEGDRFWLQNRPEWIDRPGEWAAVPLSGPENDETQFQLYFKPAREDDLKRVEAAGAEGSVVNVRNNHVHIEGLEVMGGRRMGIEVHGAEDVEIERCVVYHNAGNGISFREVRGGRIGACVAWYNRSGVTVSYSSRVVVEHCDVGYNHMDGILPTWKSEDIVVRRNYAHHHLRWGHPDNMQVYRDVKGLQIIENLLLAGGQSLMTEETSNGLLRGNMIVGSGAGMVIFGHENTNNYRVEGNTFALSGYDCLRLTGRDYAVYENIFMTGHGGPAYGTRGVEGYSGDRNLLWNSSRAENPTIMATDDGWLKDFAAVQASLGREDQHSVYAPPAFRNAPVAFGVVDHRRLLDCTTGLWYVRGGTGLFRAGDHVEADFDGVVREVVSVDEQAGELTVAPPLDALPPKGWLIGNWGESRDFQLDLRLKEAGPAARLSEEGGPIGSAIDMAAYQRGDFTGDGRRDLPELPTDW